ncbi:MAG: hypothetical protein ABI772_05120 [Bacteroidota bacterium]
MKKLVSSSLLCAFLFFAALVSILAVQRWKTKSKTESHLEYIK